MVMMELGRQLLRAGTGVGANYRAARRAQSDPDLLTKLKKVEEESDESMFGWTTSCWWDSIRRWQPAPNSSTADATK